MILNYKYIKEHFDKKEIDRNKFIDSQEQYVFQGKGRSTKYDISKEFWKLTYVFSAKSIKKEIKGAIEFIEPNIFILRKNSEYLNRQVGNKQFGKFNKILRQEIKENKWCLEYDEYSILTEDVCFYAPSGVSCFITGRASPAYYALGWMGKNNKILNEKFKEYKNNEFVDNKSLFQEKNELTVQEYSEDNLNYLNIYENISIKEQKELKKIWNRKDIDDQTKTHLSESRVGQGKYRKDLLTLHNNMCMISNIKAPELLIASHIVPWVESNNHARLDENNGLLLSASIDKLFDQHYISFDDNGFMIISEKFKQIHPNYKEIMSTIGIYESFIEQKKHLKLSDETKKYMKKHFEKLKK